MSWPSAPTSDVARYSGIRVDRVRTIAYVIQGLCVAVAVLLYVPRLGSTSATTGILWELQAITAVVIGGTALKGGVGRVWGTVCGAFILELVGNIMVLSNFVSEYLIGAIQGSIIIIAMLVQRSLRRKREQSRAYGATRPLTIEARELTGRRQCSRKSSAWLSPPRRLLPAPPPGAVPRTRRRSASRSRPPTMAGRPASSITPNASPS